jgi:hypothetical protein
MLQWYVLDIRIYIVVRDSEGQRFFPISPHQGVFRAVIGQVACEG